MLRLQSITSFLGACKPYRHEITGGVCLITSIVLLVLAIHQMQLTHFSSQWVGFTPNIHQPFSLAFTLLLFGMSGFLAGICLSSIKSVISKKIEQKKIKVRPLLANVLEKWNFIYCVFIMVAMVAGLALLVYGSHYFLQGHTVYLVQGHALEWALASIVGGAALMSGGFLECLKKGPPKISKKLRIEK